MVPRKNFCRILMFEATWVTLTERIEQVWSCDSYLPDVTILSFYLVFVAEKIGIRQKFYIGALFIPWLHWNWFWCLDEFDDINCIVSSTVTYLPPYSKTDVFLMIFVCLFFLWSITVIDQIRNLNIWINNKSGSEIFFLKFDLLIY